MTLGKLWSGTPDPNAKSSWIGQALWVATPIALPNWRGSGEWVDVEALALSVPGPFLSTITSPAHGACRGVASLLEDNGSAIGVLVFVAADDVVIAALDLAGEQTGQLLQAALDGKVCAIACAEGGSEASPMLPIDGLAETMTKARAFPRLSGRDFEHAVAKLRATLTTPELFSLVGARESPFGSLTVNVCQPPRGQEF